MDAGSCIRKVDFCCSLWLFIDNIREHQGLCILLSSQVRLSPPPWHSFLVECWLRHIIHRVTKGIPDSVCRAGSAVVDQGPFIGDWRELPTPFLFVNVAERLASKNTQLC